MQRGVDFGRIFGELQQCAYPVALDARILTRDGVLQICEDHTQPGVVVVPSPLLDHEELVGVYELAQLMTME